MSNLNYIKKEFEEKLKKVNSKNDLQTLKSEYFGKNGIVTSEFKKMGSLEENLRKDFAKKLNLIKNDLTNIIENKFKSIEKEEINKKLDDEKIDITLPIRSQFSGKIHPVSQVIDEISSIFSEIGFTVAEGPDVESEYNLSLIHI